MTDAPIALSRRATAEEVPVIDFSPLASGNESAIERVSREVHDACRDAGFFTVINHPVPPAAIKDIFAASKRFFHQPLDAKMRVHMGLSENFRGFIPTERGQEERHFRGRAIPGFQNHINDTQLKKRKDNKNEVFQISAELPPDDPDVMAGKPLHGANLWPDDLPGFRDSVLGYYGIMQGFAMQMAGVFARGLGLEPDYFARYYRKPLMQLRLLHYLPQPPEIAVETGNSIAHCDAGGFTMLQQDDTGGLEIMTPKGEWVVVPPVENSFVVNIADTMKLWTNHRFASTLHRVVNRYGKERFSVGFFTNPDYDAEITPIPTCVGPDDPPRFESMKTGDAMLYLYSRIWPSKAGGAEAA